MRSVLTALKEQYGGAVAFQMIELDPMVPLGEQQAAVDFKIDGHPYTAVLDPRGRLVDLWPGVVQENELVSALRSAGMK